MRGDLPLIRLIEMMGSLKVWATSSHRRHSLAGLILIGCSLLWFGEGRGAAQERTEPSTPEGAIRTVLHEQVAAWNRGDLSRFMDGYWRSEQLTFYSGSRRLQGWEATLTRYRQTYQAEGKEMGHLTFSQVEVELLGEDGALVRGSWHLRFGDDSTAGGIYTLVFRRFPNGWKIIHDHTSS
jgi:ketosteroid isomerase-like protein